MEKSYEERLEEAKRGSLLQVLFRCGRLLNERALQRFREETGQSQFREVHLRLFPYVELEGTRLTVLASRLGVSKQAAAQWVDELVSMGVLEKVPDPSDGRARLIRFSEDGRQGMLEGLALLKALEGELADAMGADAIQSLHELLLQLLDHVEEVGG